MRSRPGKSGGSANAVASATRPRIPLQAMTTAPRGLRAPSFWARIGTPALHRGENQAIDEHPDNAHCDDQRLSS